MRSAFASFPAHWEELAALLPPSLRAIVTALPASALHELRELRLRTHRPVVGVFRRGQRYLAPGGAMSAVPDDAYWLTNDDAERFFHAITRSSVYALQRELRQGFITLPGGHRVGFGGRLAPARDGFLAFRDVSSFNVRIARQIPGAAAVLLPHLHVTTERSRRIPHTLIASPPGCGKTTVLRDLARMLSQQRSYATGTDGGGCRGPGWRVVIVDERFEIAAGYRGIPQFDVGPNTDVIDGCSKAEGLAMALRSLAPQVLVTDEIGNPTDLAALREAARCGVAVVASVHADSVADALRRAGPPAGPDWERVVLLSDRYGPGTVEHIAVISPSPSQ